MKLLAHPLRPLTLFAVAFLCACGASPDRENLPQTLDAAAATVPAAPLPDVTPLLNKLTSQGGCKDSTAEMRLTFAGEGGKREQLDFRLQRRYADGQIATLLTVLAPREETSKSLLAFQKPDQPTEAISYLAGLKSVTRLGSARPLNFRGSRSSVQELLGLELNQYTPQPPTRVTEGGATLLKVELKEKRDRDLAYPRIVAFFREAADLEPARFELLNSRGEVAKIVRVVEYKTIQNYPTITHVEIEDKEQNRELELTTRDIKYDRSLAPALFTQERLIKAVTEASQQLVR